METGKLQTVRDYVAPVLEIIEIEAEKGFASSGDYDDLFPGGGGY